MTKILTFEAPVRYAKVFLDNRDMKGYEDAFVECNGAYTIDVGLNDVQIQELHESGSKLQGREEDGLTWCKFKRKHEVRNNTTGEIIEDFSGPPRVVDADGVEWVHTEDDPNLIGNESLCNVAVSVSPDKKRKAISYTRLEGLQVLELVEYDPETSGKPKLPF